MSAFWSSWITILSLACWLSMLVLLVVTLTKFKPKLEEDGTTGHVYDGIREYDKPMPKWWLIIFFGTMTWGILYWVLYPGLYPKSWTGITTVEVGGKTLPWTEVNELNSALEKNNAVFLNSFNNKMLQNKQIEGELATLAGLQQKLYGDAKPASGLKGQINKKVASLAPAVVSLSENPNALKVGQKLFLQNCAVCHGSNAKGAMGYPNLTDGDWLYGGTPKDILHTLHNGRVGGMIAWKEQLGETGVAAVSEYVLSLSSAAQSKANAPLDQQMINQGKAIFETNCTVCHGKDAKGSTAVGAPNLTDDIWLYGGDRNAVQETVRKGRAGVMPAWQTTLGNERIMLLAAYVYSLSNTPNSAS